MDQYTEPGALCELGITNTPTLVINGYRRQGTIYEWALRKILDSIAPESEAASD